MSPALVAVTIHAPALLAVRTVPFREQIAAVEGSKVYVTAPVPLPPVVLRLKVTGVLAFQLGEELIVTFSADWFVLLTTTSICVV
jgi:hypothetical protein